jgi:hypothetical protein
VKAIRSRSSRPGRNLRRRCRHMVETELAALGSDLLPFALSSGSQRPLECARPPVVHPASDGKASVSAHRRSSFETRLAFGDDPGWERVLAVEVVELDMTQPDGTAAQLDVVCHSRPRGVVCRSLAATLVRGKHRAVSRA